MKIAIISDSHDNIVNLEKFINWANKNEIEKIIHCGDLCGPNVVTDVIASNFKGDVHFVYGNVGDRETLEKKIQGVDNVKFYGDRGEIEIENKKIAFVHRPEEAKELAKTDKYDFIFYGHTHEPWEEKIGKTRLYNPGTLAGMFNKATFAVYNTESDKVELKILEQI